MEKREWVVKPITFDNDARLLLFGMPFIGGWLPRLAFSSDVKFDSVFQPTEKVKVEYFLAEWFLSGVAIVYKMTITPMFK